MDIKRLENEFYLINKIGKSDNGINRLAYSSEEREAIKYLQNLCIKEGLEVTIDPCGNLIARREGEDPALPVVACGSHLDTVYEGGNYDGTVGVLAGLEVIRSLNDNKIKTLHPIELIVFACEESSRFGVSTIGSKAMSGILNIDSIKKLTDKKGITIDKAFKDSGLDFNSIGKCRRSKDDIKAFVEVHIEQGPHLENKNSQIGIVTGISAPTRLKVKVKGVASHSGTTNMDERKDALIGASMIVLDLVKKAKEESENGTVATVGTLDIKPGAINVVPGYAELQIDIRGTSKTSKNNVLNGIIKTFEEIEKTRDLNINWELISDENPVLTDENIQNVIKSNCEKLKLRSTFMHSGAGHDTMNIAKIWPAGMIFIPSKDGLSHNPKEYSDMQDIANGTSLLESTLLDLAGQVILAEQVV